MNRRRQPPKRSSRHRRRLFVLQSAVVIGLGVVAWRLAFVQRSFGPDLLAKAAKSDTVKGVLIAPRGELLDDQGRPLAYDLPAYTMDMNLKPLQSQLPEVASIIAKAIGDTTPKALAFLSGHTSWVEWPRPVLEPAREQISAAIAKLSSQPIGDLVTFTPTEERFYPNGVFASNVIGYINRQNIGQTGLEQKYNQELTGSDGEFSYTAEATGFPVQSTYQVLTPAKAGNDIKLTIDQTIQGFVEQAMNSLITKDHPARAAIVVMNPKSGAILAMTSRPTFNPNNYQNASLTALSSDWAVNARFEPGSTFKPIVLAAALAEHKILLSDTFMSGHTIIAGDQINDWNFSGWGQLTFLGALEKSSNVGFAKIAEKLGWPDLLTYMQRFGYLDTTGIDLPNEANSIIFSPQYRGPLQLATSGFGQGIAVTPLQQMDGIAAIANGGTLYKPYVASSIINPNTHSVVRQFGPTVVRRNVVPPDVAAQVNKALIADVNDPAGIDTIAVLPGYDVAGKTGTAQIPKPNGGYYNNRFIVSFIGYAPGWDPQFEVYVTLDWPKTPIGNTWGSTLAAPTARDILQDCLQYYHIQPHNESSKLPSSTSSVAPTTTNYIQVPDFTGHSVSAAKSKGTKLNVSINVVGSGTSVTGQWPVAGTEVIQGGTVYLSTASSNGHNGAQSMPNLIGAPMRLAGDILASMGVQMTPVGTGFVVKQSIAPGQTVQAGMTVTLTLAPTAAASPLKGSSKP